MTTGSTLPAGLRSALERIAEKATVTQPYRVAPHLSQCVLVVGGGPIGLRAACELALLGHKVTLLEKRDAITRLNVLKLWEATARDLNSLGLDKLDRQYCNGGAKLASTSRLQLVLLKVALLLGVKVRLEEGDLQSTSAFSAILVATGAKSQNAVLGGLGFTPGPRNADGPNCIAVVAHFEFVGEWRTLADDINWTYKDAANKSSEALERMQEQFGLYVISPEPLEAEGIFIEQFLCYINRAQSANGEGVS